MNVDLQRDKFYSDNFVAKGNKNNNIEFLPVPDRIFLIF